MPIASPCNYTLIRASGPDAKRPQGIIRLSRRVTHSDTSRDSRVDLVIRHGMVLEDLMQKGRKLTVLLKKIKDIFS